MIEPYSLKPQEINVPNKPPRNKFEVKPPMNPESLPQRVMIGTYMIHQKNSPEHTMNRNGGYNNGYLTNEVRFDSQSCGKSSEICGVFFREMKC